MEEDLNRIAVDSVTRIIKKLTDYHDILFLNLRNVPVCDIKQAEEEICSAINNAIHNIELDGDLY